MNGIVTFGVGITVSLIMLVAATLIHVLPKFAGITWARAVVLPLILAGTSGLVAVTVFGFSISGLFNKGMTAVDSGLRAVAPGVAYAVPILIAIAAFAVFAHDAWAVSISKRSVLAAVTVPVSLGFIPGAVGTGATTLTALPVTGLAAAFTAMFGLG